MWALLGHRAGDNLQVEALAEALGWPWERKRLSWRKRLVGWTPFYGRAASLVPLTREARGPIAPPWPDVVLAIGWRSVPVARWIGRQSRARLVHLGRPRAPLEAFHLVLTTPQYQLPDAANVVQLEAPLTRLSPELLQMEAGRWRVRFAHLPRPWIAVLIGGDAPPLRLTPKSAAELAARADAMAHACGGSLLITTGPRTDGETANAFLAQITAPAHCYVWGKIRDENPYFGYLALADEFVVTSDSISMVHEASLTGKQVHLFNVPSSPSPPLRGLHWADRRLRTNAGPAAGIYLDAIRYGWVYPPRNPDAFLAVLLRSGRAVHLGETAKPPARHSVARETERAVTAVRGLLAPSGPSVQP